MNIDIRNIDGYRVSRYPDGSASAIHLDSGASIHLPAEVARKTATSEILALIKSKAA